MDESVGLQRCARTHQWCGMSPGCMCGRMCGGTCDLGPGCICDGRFGRCDSTDMCVCVESACTGGFGAAAVRPFGRCGGHGADPPHAAAAGVLQVGSAGVFCGCCAVGVLQVGSAEVFCGGCAVGVLQVGSAEVFCGCCAVGVLQVGSAMASSGGCAVGML
eukprot:353572-Chlamydomonas_euryale.AAC.11